MKSRALVLAALLLAGCGTTPSSVCRAQCDKRAECGQTIDADACHRACDSATSPGNAACQEADQALQACQVKQSCEAYLAGTGCEAETTRSSEACR